MVDNSMIEATLLAARDWQNETPEIVWRTRYAMDVATLLERQKETYCAYCGATFPIGDDASKVADHIRSCPKHPMYELRRLSVEMVAAWRRGDDRDAVIALERFLRSEP